MVSGTTTLKYRPMQVLRLVCPFRGRHHETRCTSIQHIQRARRIAGKQRLGAGRLRVRRAVWPREVQHETRRRHFFATAPSRSGPR
jgi:hypothetical protein